MDDSTALTNAEVASKGGKARAAKLTAEERRSIARKAAEARWLANLPKSTYGGVVTLGDTEIACFVLDDGERVVCIGGVMKAFGRRGRKHSDIEFPDCLAAKNLKPFVSKELANNLFVIEFRTPEGPKANGFKANLLPLLCETYQRGRDAKVLTPRQMRVAVRADTLMRSLAHVGIIALVDEATGYQEVCDKQSLQAILDRYLRKEFAAWARHFPTEFYREIFRIHRLTWKGMKVDRPQCLANYTKELVFARLAPSIISELETRNPLEDRRRRSPHCNLLAEEPGHFALAKHLHAIIGFMRASDDWDQLIKMLNRAFPKIEQDTSHPEVLFGER